jgi:4-hydroxybenzoate polyprenyltransferase
MKAIPGVGLQRGRSELFVYLSCIRYQDVVLLQGSPLLGAAFALKEPTLESLPGVLVFALASLLLVAHIFTFNDWAGVASDSNDPHKAAKVFSTKGATPRNVLRFSGGLLALSLLLFAFAPFRTLLVAAAIAILGVLYSHPSVHAKGIPVLSSVLHLTGGLLHFLLGYSLFSAIDHRGVLIALFFALTFTAGHLNQEVRDYEGDRLNGLSTNAVAFGRTAAFLAGLVMFTLAYADLFLLAATGMVPTALTVLPVVLFPIHVFWSLTTLRGGLTFGRVSQFQRRYRMLYALIGLAIGVALVLR